MRPQQVRILAITKQNVEKEAKHLTNGTKGQRQTQRQWQRQTYYVWKSIGQLVTGRKGDTASNLGVYQLFWKLFDGAGHFSDFEI